MEERHIEQYLIHFPAMVEMNIQLYYKYLIFYLLKSDHISNHFKKYIFCTSLSICALVIKYERSGSFKTYVLPLLKKVIVVPLITCCGLEGLIVN